MQTIIFALHATQLAPHAIEAEMEGVYLALFHCIFIMGCVWLNAGINIMPRHLLQYVNPAPQAAILVQKLVSPGVYLVVTLSISTLF